jgi:4-amino-4-deoxy-L-arabinose transferase-like glycosyltransferase
MRIIKFLIDHKIWIIILVGFFIRTLSIDLSPPSLNWDEISHGYNAYSILHTGNDEWGHHLPTIFRAYGDYKLPVYIYLTALSEFFLGLSDLSIRFASVIFGTLGILLTYLLTKEISKNNKLALFSALLVCIEPWTFFLSRGGFEANVSWVLTLGGILAFLKSLKNPRYLVLSSILLGLSVWTYNSARIFIPTLIILIAVIYRQEIAVQARKSSKLFCLSIAIFVIFLAPMFYQLLHTEGSARYTNVAILDEGAINTINSSRGSSNLPPVAAHLMYNKVTYFSVEFIKNWLSHFSPNFLFLNGGSQYQFNVPNMGLLYMPDLLFISVGLFYLAKNRKDKTSKLLIGWLLLAPVASALTRESPHTLRASTLLPLPMNIIN